MNSRKREPNGLDIAVQLLLKRDWWWSLIVAFGFAFFMGYAFPLYLNQKHKVFSELSQLIAMVGYMLTLFFCIIAVIIYFKQKRNQYLNNEIIDLNEFENPVELYPYKTRGSILTQTEYYFLPSLIKAVNSRANILMKVGIKDILYVAVDNRQDYNHYFNKIRQKHVDFVLCDKRNKLEILGAVELDDPSHEKASRKERDVFLNKAFRAAKLPLIRIKTASTYSQEEIKQKLELIWPDYSPKIKND